MAGVLGAASIPFIALVALLMGMILHIIGFASPFWAEDDTGDLGLWRWHRCIPKSEVSAADDEGCYRRNHPWEVAEWLDAVRGLTSLTIIFWAIPLVVLPVYIYVALGLYYRCTLGIMTLLVFFGDACVIAGVVLFHIKVEDKSSWSIGWSLILCDVAAVFGIIACIVLFISTIKRRPNFDPAERYYVSGFYVDPDKNQLYVVESLAPPKGGALPQ